MNIEDDLSASPVALRRELRRLRAMLPRDLSGSRDQQWAIGEAIREEIAFLTSLLTVSADGTVFDDRASTLASVARDFLCPVLACNEGAACACSGICYRNAKRIIEDLEKGGFTIVKMRVGR